MYSLQRIFKNQKRMFHFSLWLSRATQRSETLRILNSALVWVICHRWSCFPSLFESPAIDGASCSCNRVLQLNIHPAKTEALNLDPSPKSLFYNKSVMDPIEGMAPPYFWSTHSDDDHEFSMTWADLNDVQIATYLIWFSALWSLPGYFKQTVFREVDRN